MGSEGIIATVLGATGAIGKEVVNELVSSPRIKEVRIIARRNVEIKSNKIVENIIDFEKLQEHKVLFDGVQVN